MPRFESSPGDRAAHPYVFLALLTFVYSMNLLDRQIVNVLAEPIKNDLGLSDTQIGVLSGLAFAIFYTLLGIPMGLLTDRVNRVKMIAACCAIWSVFTALCGLGQNFLQLALARVGVATGEAGGTPPSYALIADYFPSGNRATAIGLFSLGAPIGGMAGALLAGTVGAAYGWRIAFFVASVPGLIAAALLLLLVREPRRGRLDTHEAAATVPLTGFVRQFFADPALIRMTIAGAIGAFTFYGSSAWLPPYLMRVKGMSLAEIGAYYGVAIGLAVAIGQLGGGALSDRLARRWPSAPASLPAVAFLVAFVFYVAGTLAGEWWLALPLLLVAAAAGIVYVGPTAATIQEASPPRQRGLASAIYLFIVHIIGLGLGPLMVGMVSDATADMPAYGGLQMGMWALAPFYPLGFVAYLWAAGPVRAFAQRRGEASTS